MSPGVARLAGWTPVHVAWPAAGDDRPVVEWRDLRGISFDDPFFGDTVDRALREPYRLVFAAHTPIDELGVVAGASGRTRPSGFVFHASRCGSTLIANMLRGLDATVVASEPPVLDGVLRADLVGRVDDETRRRWLGWAVDCLGQADGGDRRLFVKFDAWSTRDIRLVRSVFPDVPCVFVYRDPAEIVASQMRMRGAHMVPGMLPAELFGLDPRAVGDLRGEEYCARVVGSILAAAGDHVAGGGADGGCRLVNYAQLPGVVADDLLGHFGVDATADELGRVGRAAAVDAKNPLLAFDPTGPGGERPITPAIRASTDRWTAAAYARLEAVRRDAAGREAA